MRPKVSRPTVGANRCRSGGFGIRGRRPGASCQTVPPGGSSIAPRPSLTTRVPAVPLGVERMRRTRQIRQELIQPVPRESAIERAPNAEIVGDDELVGVGGRNREAVLAGPDDRGRLVRREVFPRASAIVGAEQLRPEPEEAGAIAGRDDDPCAGVREARGAVRPRTAAGSEGGFGGCPGFVIGCLEDSSGPGAREKERSAGGKPDLIDGAGGRRGEREIDGRAADLAPVGRGLRPSGCCA